MRVFQRAVVASLIAGLWPAMAAQARAQAGWGGAPTPLSPIYSDIATYAPKVAADGAGNARAIWVENSASFVGSVKTARFDAATKVWSAAETLSDEATTFVHEPQVAVDGAGNAVASWFASDGAGGAQVRAARYSAAGGTWTPVPLAGTFTNRALVAANAGGDAVIVWNETASAGFAAPVRLLARRYTAATGTWNSVDVLAPSLANTPQPGDVAIDGVGNIVVVWLGSSMVQATRFAAATGSWSDVANLSSPISNLAVPPPDVAMSPAGEALVSWARLTGIEAARWPAGGNAWAAPVSFTATGADVARTAIDPAGNAVVAWTTTTSATARQLWAARYSADTATWSGPVALSSGALVLGSPSVAMDSLGNAFVLCSQLTPRPAPVSVFAARQAAATGAWTVSPNLSGPAQDAYGPDVAVDAAGNAIAVWQQQLPGGLAATLARRWAATPPPPTVTAVSPGAGTLSVSFTLTPPMSATALEYSLDDGATWTAAAVTSPVVIVGLTDGIVQRLRLRGLNAAGAGDASDLIPVRSGVGTTPTDFRVVARTANTATFAWLAPVAGIVPDGYLIEGGLAGQTQVLATVPTGGAATQVTLAVPNGVFFVRVVAQRGTIRLGQSADLQLAVNAGAFPAAPTNLLGSAAGQRLALSWVNPLNGGASTGMRIDVSGSITTAIDLPVTEQVAFDGVPPGTYTFAVTPLINSVPGDASNVVTLTFPGTCSGPPGTPTAFSASTQAGRIYLDWLPPTSGAAVTHYVVHATGAFTGSFPLAVRTFSAPVPPGSYTVSIASAGPCGTSAPTAAPTVVVP